MFIAKNHWSGLSPLVSSTQCWAPTRTLSGHPAATLCCGNPAVLGLRVRSLHMLWQLIDGVDVETGQVITLGLGLGSCRVGPPDGKWGQLSYDHSFGADSPTLLLTGLALLYRAGEVQGLHF